MKQETDGNLSLHENKIGDWVLYKNNQLIAFNKPPGLPVQSDKTGDLSLHQLAEIYCKSKLYLLHRLDRPASGIVLFAKTKGAVASISEQFRERQVQKKYLAVVGGLPPEREGVAVHFLQKNSRANRSQASEEEKPDSLRSELKYKVLGSIENYHLLEVGMLSGRHHQIRAQLAQMGCPIKGDVKYGFRRKNRDRSIHLHAWKMTFKHPVTGEATALIAPLPIEVVWEAVGSTCGLDL